MLKIIAVDLSAQARQRITAQLHDFFVSAAEAGVFTARVTVQALTFEELHFHGNPDLYFVGQELAQTDAAAIAALRSAAPLVPILAEIPPERAAPHALEQLLRLGVTDVFVQGSSRDEFLRKFLVLTRERKGARSGKLIIVESAKGGLGVTSMAAALGELLLDRGQRVCLVDLDLDSQDLSRFLQARPFVNENLQSLLERQRPISEETVAQSVTRIWQDLDLYCLAPPLDSEKLMQRGNAAVRGFMEVIEILDAAYDFVIVDPGCCRGALLEMLYATADLALLVVNNDAATLYASMLKISCIRALSPAIQLRLIENSPLRHGLSNALLRREFLRAAGLDAGEWLSTAIPFSAAGAKWPASGGTLYSQGGVKLRRALGSCADKLGFLSPQAAGASAPVGKANQLWKLVRPRLRGPELRKALPAPEGNWRAPPQDNCGADESEGLKASALVSGVTF